MKVGILGGSFDPVHFGHLIIAEQAIKKFVLQKVVFIPSFHHPFKHSNFKFNFATRIQMLQAAISEHKDLNGNAEISSIESEFSGTNYTFNTLTNLIKRNQDWNIFFIIGTDILEELPKWQKIEPLAQMVEWIVFRRKGVDNSDNINNIKKSFSAEISEKILKNFLTVDTPEISSTQIKLKLEQNENISQWLPESVINIININ